MNQRMNQVWRALMRTSFMDGPSFVNDSTKRVGGLLQHCIKFWMYLEDITATQNLEWKNPDSPFIIAMLHRVYEIDAYYWEDYYKVWEDKDHRHYASDVFQLIDDLGIELNEEERACIAYYNINFRDKSILEQYPNARWMEFETCCLCGRHITKGFENNPSPVAEDGVCCGYCNLNKVIPARLQKRLKED